MQEVKRHIVIPTHVRFDLEIPKDVPKENATLYAQEKLKRILAKIGQMKGVDVKYEPFCN